MKNKSWERYFDSSFYELQLPSKIKIAKSLEEHYEDYGTKRKFSINPLFDTKYYSTFNSIPPETDVFEHYEHNDIDAQIHPLFDGEYYLKQLENVHPQNESLLLHFLNEGWKRNLNTSRYFDSEYYLNQYPDVKSLNKNPLIHYMLNGENESRSPHPDISAEALSSKNYSEHLIRKYTKLGCFAIEQKYEDAFLFENLKNSIAKNFDFERSNHSIKELLNRFKNSFDKDYYLTTYVDVAEHNIDPLEHYITNGFKEGRNPHPFFDTAFFRNLYTINNKDIDAFILYLSHNKKHLTPHPFFHTNYYQQEIQKRNLYINQTLLEYYDDDTSDDKIYPSPLFDLEYYLNTIEETKDPISDPFLHFINIGVYENKLPSDLHDYKRYLWENPDVALRQINPILHYTKHGRFERRALYEKQKAIVSKPELIPSLKIDGKKLKITIWVDSDQKHIIKPINDGDLEIKTVAIDKNDAIKEQLQTLLEKSKGSDLIYRHNPNESKYCILTINELVAQASKNIAILMEEDQQIGLVGPLSFFNRISEVYNNDINAYRYYINSFQSEDDWGFFSAGSYAFNPTLLRSILRSEILNSNHPNCLNYTDQQFDISIQIGILDLLIHRETFINDLNVALYYSTTPVIESLNFILVNAKSASKWALEYPARTALLEKELTNYSQDINKSSLFDKEYYLNNNEQFLTIDNPIIHYLRYGAFLQYDPSISFSNGVYFKTYAQESILNPLVHFLKNDNRCAAFPLENSEEHKTLIEKYSKQLDEDFYSNHVEIKNVKINSHDHYFKIGWKYHLEPNSDQTGHLYFSKLKNGKDIDYNPVLHEAILNPQHKRKQSFLDAFLNKESKGINLSPGFKRAILFAAYNKNDVIPQATLNYLNELKKYGEIYYLTDNQMPSHEMDRLQGLVVEAFSCKHASYDFGSYKRLMVNILGWSKIMEYDEVMWVNDSCFLLSELDPLFQKIENQNLDFWGIQATKGMYKTRHLEENKFKEKIKTSKIFKLFNKSFKKKPNFDFHIGSYFIGFRKTILEDTDFQNFVENIQKETTKEHIIIKYEFGLTKLLLQKSYKCRTFLDHIYPFHPIYGPQYFEILKQGFPLLKKYLLTKNHYRIPHLNEWKSKLQGYTSDANLDLIENEIEYLENYESCYNNQHYPVVAMEPDEFIAADLEIEKEDNWWVFPVCGFSHTLAGNTRAVFEAVKDDPQIKKIVLCRSQKPILQGVNVHILPLRSEESNYYLLRSKVVFLKHTIYRNAHYNLDATNRVIINLWHGIPLKRIGTASLDQQNNLDFFDIENSKYKAVIASSLTDAINMKNAFLPLTEENIWVTGLPRIDFILCEEEYLPPDYKAELEQLRKLKNGKKLIAYVPTFRNAQEMYDFTLDKKLELIELLQSNNTIIGFREHMASKVNYMDQFSQFDTLDLSGAKFKHIEMIYREADVLITDYSSAYIDYILLNKPVISFAYDLDNYKENERGFFYELENVFPGYICNDFMDLKQAITEVFAFETVNDPFKDKREDVLKLLFKYRDSDNAKRVINKIKIELNLK